MKILLTVAAILKVTVLSLLLHPMHVSVTEIEFDEKDKRLEIMMRVFIDDLEVSLRNRLNKPELDLLSPKEAANLDPMIKEYLNKNFKITLDGKPQSALYLGHERDGEAFIFYIEVSKIKKFRTIEVENAVITETHEDQNNLVNITVKDVVRSLRLTRSNASVIVTFDSK